jgi:hypothetical protein
MRPKEPMRQREFKPGKEKLPTKMVDRSTYNPAKVDAALKAFGTKEPPKR